MRQLLGIFLAGAVAMSPIQAGAEQQQDRKTSDRVLERYSECVVKHRPQTLNRVDQYLAVPIGGARDAKLVRKLIIPQCLSNAGQMTMDPELFARALFTALYRKEFRDTAPNSFAVASSYDNEYAPEFRPLDSGDYSLRHMGDCIVVHDLGAAHEYVLAKVWSDDDSKILPEVIKAAGQCVVAGQSMKFSAPMLKGIMAESLYKYRKGLTTIVGEENP